MRKIHHKIFTSLNKTSRSREQEQREGENKLKEIIEENSWAGER